MLSVCIDAARVEELAILSAKERVLPRQSIKGEVYLEGLVEDSVFVTRGVLERLSSPDAGLVLTL